MTSTRSWRREWGVLVVAALVALPLFTPRLYAADELKYLTHLRSVWFDGDLHYANDYDLLIAQSPETNAWLASLRDPPTSTGRRLNDAPIGTPILWAPVYALADLAVIVARAVGADVERDGVSRPYVVAVCVASLIWGLLGLALVYRSCRLFVDRWSAQTALLGIWFASAVVFYLYITPPMAHSTSLFAVALFVWLWLRDRDRRELFGWLRLGLAAGLMVLVRELNWLLLLAPAADEAWRLASAGRRNALAELRARLPGYALFVGTVAAVAAPQFLVYRALHGSFSPTPFVVAKFSYPTHVLEVLFSGFHGLFTWHPVTLLGVVGLALLARRHPVVAASAGLVVATQVLVIGSYASWWGGAAFGARRFINCTPLFALGLAALLQEVPAVRRRAAAVAMIALVIWNFGLALQYATGMIPRDRPVTVARIVTNQVVHVPRRAASVAWRFLFDRWSMVDNAPGGGR